MNSTNRTHARILFFYALALAMAPGATPSSAELPVDAEWALLPAGEFLQGDARQYAAEVPVHAVAIRAFELARHEVTRGEFAAFVADTAYRTEAERGDGCYVLRDGDPVLEAAASWRDPGFPQDDSHPVVCVTWNDAQAYIGWLSRKSGAQYRLPTESEFEYATRAGSTTTWPWGDTLWHDTRQCGPGGGNVRDFSTVPALTRSADYVAQCNDGYVFTAPVGLYGANAFGVFDINGNVSEWVQDCYGGDRYDGAPNDGSAWEWQGCERRGFRGGNWADVTPASSDRAGVADQWPTPAFTVLGFRVARSG